MAKQRQRQIKNGRASGNHDVLGIMLIVISLFLFICIAIPPILSVVSRAIFNIMLGVFGFAAYPSLIALFLLGVFILRRKTVALSVKAVVCTALLAFFVLMILQLATTHAFLKQSYVDYIASVYSAKYSAGGVIIGTLAFGIQAVITEIASYVIYSLAVLIVLAVMFDLVGRIRAHRGEVKPKKKDVEKLPDRPDFAAPAEPQRVTPVETKKELFIYEIKPSAAKIQTESGKASELDAREKRRVSDYFSEPLIDTDDYGHEDESDSRRQSAAHAALYGDRNEIYKKNTEEFIRQVDDRPPQYDSQIEFKPNGGVVEPYERVNADARNNAGPKRVDYDGMSDDFSLLTFPVEKNPVFNDEGIENVDEITARLKAQNEARLLSDIAESRRDERMPQRSNPSFAFGEPAAPPEPIEQIIDGSKRQAPIEPVAPQEPEPQPFDVPRFDSRTPEEEFADAVSETFDLPPQEDIIDAFEQRDRYTQPETDETQTDDDIITGIEDAKRLAPEPAHRIVVPDGDDGIIGGSSLVISDEPVRDLSETHDVTSDVIDGGDSTGMYVAAEEEPEAAPAVKPKRVSKNNVPLENQITIETVLKNNADSVVLNERKHHKKYTTYTPPPIDLLRVYEKTELSQDELDRNAKTLETVVGNILKSEVRVIGVVVGPTVTRYELDVPMGVDIRAIEARRANIEYELAARSEIRIEAPIPGKRAVGIEVPNPEQGTVGLREIVESKEFAKAKSPLTVAIGKGISGDLVMCNLEKVPHLLIAGQTGSGKSACLNGLLVSLLYKSSPEDLRFILIDPKRVEFSKYNSMPHLLFDRIVLEPGEALNALKWAANEMERRYTVLQKYACSQVSEFNKLPDVQNGNIDKLPHIIVVVDELADLMQSQFKNDIESRIMVIAAKARAAGIHLIVATQRPSADVITGTIKTNLTSRIAFKVMSLVDSRIILDQSGAEALVGKGDMLFSPVDFSSPARVQGSFIDGDEVAAVVNYIKDNYETDFDESAAKFVFGGGGGKGGDNGGGEGGGNMDPLIPRALAQAIASKQASISVVQRRFSIGYARAARIIDYMEEKGYIGPSTGNSKPREVLITQEQYSELFGDDGDEG